MKTISDPWGTRVLLPVAYLVATLVILGCDNSGPEELELDDQLEQVLTDASSGAGLSFFTMPNSSDLQAIPQDPTNPLTAEKVSLGQLLYHESALMVNAVRPEGALSASCASCHHAKAGFQAGRIQGIGEGGMGFGQSGEGRVNNPNYPIEELDVQPIRTPTAMNGAYQEVMLWNGQFGATGPNAGTSDRWMPDTPIETNNLGYQGLEIQAIAGLAVHRMADVEQSLVYSDPTYQTMFEAAFPGQEINRERAGLAIAAYERTLFANQAPFQLWLRGNRGAMSTEAKRGALVFFGKGNCVACHTGPALNSMTFYALGMNDLAGVGVYGDHSQSEARLGRGSFTGNPADNYKFKTPQLYNLTDSPFYGHGGGFTTVRDVVNYKNAAVPENTEVPGGQLASAFQPLGLTPEEIDDLVAFIETGLHDPNLERYVPTSVPSGHCLPANDTQAQQDLGC